MKDVIRGEIEKIERECGVRILLTIDSGSRAWGIASEDSDYDVRFVYVRPVRDYLRLEKLKDTIDWQLDDVLDMSGWDLAKFLQLVRGSNPSAFEWLSSPVVYQESEDFGRIRDVSAGCFSPKASAFHYLGITRSNTKSIASDGDTVSAKTCLYAMRGLLAARWCLEEKSPAPMRFEDLLQAKLPASLIPEARKLLAVKVAGKGSYETARNAAIDAWIQEEDSALYAMAQAEPPSPKAPWTALDEAFVELVFPDRA